MPTYEYECSNCGYGFDKVQSMSEAILQRCPKCKENKLRRLIGMGAGFIFKGPGFYATDYKKPQKEKVKKQEDKSSCSKCELSSKKPCPNANK